MPGSDVRVGTSGWRYASWRGDFYPDGLVQRRELEHLSRRLGTVEINGSFYSLQRPSSYRSWAAQTPDDFVFAVKGGRFITHLRALQEPETGLANFFASGVLLLGSKLGPFLWQLPQRLPFDARTLEEFCAALPDTTGTAARLARRHDERVRHVEIPEEDPRRRLRHAIEPRHPSFADPDALGILRDHGVALVVSDGAGHWPVFTEATADFVYLRLHGSPDLYASGYDRRSLERWAETVRRLTTERADRPRDAYVYFDNDSRGRAPHDAEAFARLLGVEPEREDRAARR